MLQTLPDELPWLHSINAPSIFMSRCLVSSVHVWEIALEIEIFGEKPFVFHSRAPKWPCYTGWAFYVRLLEAKWHNLRYYAHCYTTDYCIVVPVSNAGVYRHGLNRLGLPRAQFWQYGYSR